MIGWAIVLALLVLFLLLKVGVWFHWDSQSSLLKVRVGLLRFAISTDEKESKQQKQKKNEKPVKQKKTDVVAAKPSGQKEKKSKKGLSPSMKSWIKALLAHWRDLLALIHKVLRSPTLDLLRIHLAVGGSDPEVCAMQYGKICAGFSAGLPVLQRLFRIKKQDIDVSCRFDLPKMEVMAEVEATVHIYEVFALVGTVLGLLIKIYLTKKSNDKAVQ